MVTLEEAIRFSLIVDLAYKEGFLEKKVLDKKLRKVRASSKKLAEHLEKAIKDGKVVGFVALPQNQESD